jgi:hypothetical protein
MQLTCKKLSASRDAPPSGTLSIGEAQSQGVSGSQDVFCMFHPIGSSSLYPDLRGPTIGILFFHPLFKYPPQRLGPNFFHYINREAVRQTKSTSTAPFPCVLWIIVTARDLRVSGRSLFEGLSGFHSCKRRSFSDRNSDSNVLPLSTIDLGLDLTRLLAPHALLRLVTLPSFLCRRCRTQLSKPPTLSIVRCSIEADPGTK